MITEIKASKIDYTYDGALHISDHDGQYWWVIDFPTGNDHITGVIQHWRPIPKSLYYEILKFNNDEAQNF